QHTQTFTVNMDIQYKKQLDEIDSVAVEFVASKKSERAYSLLKDSTFSAAGNFIGAVASSAVNRIKSRYYSTGDKSEYLDDGTALSVEAHSLYLSLLRATRKDRFFTSLSQEDRTWILNFLEANPTHATRSGIPPEITYKLQSLDKSLAWEEKESPVATGVFTTLEKLNLLTENLMDSFQQLRPVNLVDNLSHLFNARTPKAIIHQMIRLLEHFGLYWQASVDSTVLLFLYNSIINLFQSFHKDATRQAGDEEEQPDEPAPVKFELPPGTQEKNNSFIKEFFGLGDNIEISQVMITALTVVASIVLLIGGSGLIMKTLQGKGSKTAGFMGMIIAVGLIAKTLTSFTQAIGVVKSAVTSFFVDVLGFEISSPTDVNRKGLIAEMFTINTQLENLRTDSAEAIKEYSQKKMEYKAIIDSADLLDKKLVVENSKCKLTAHSLEWKTFKDNKLKVKEWIKSINSTLSRKQCPATLYIYGVSGIGKSYLCNYITKKLSDIYHRVISSFTRNPQDEFWSGYAGQDVVIIDDYTTNSDDKDAMELTAMFSDQSYNPPMASLETKGMPFCSKFLLVCSNNPYLASSQNMRDVSKLHRRRHITIEVVDDEYTTGLSQNCRDFKEDFSHLKFRLKHNVPTGVVGTLADIDPEHNYTLEEIVKRLASIEVQMREIYENTIADSIERIMKFKENQSKPFKPVEDISTGNVKWDLRKEEVIPERDDEASSMTTEDGELEKAYDYFMERNTSMCRSEHQKRVMWGKIVAATKTFDEREVPYVKCTKPHKLYKEEGGGDVKTMRVGDFQTALSMALGMEVNDLMKTIKRFDANYSRANVISFTDFLRFAGGNKEKMAYAQRATQLSQGKTELKLEDAVFLSYLFAVPIRISNLKDEMLFGFDSEVAINIICEKGEFWIRYKEGILPREAITFGNHVWMDVSPISYGEPFEPQPEREGSKTESKVIILLGKAGTGKSYLLNSMDFRVRTAPEAFKAYEEETLKGQKIHLEDAFRNPFDYETIATLIMKQYDIGPFGILAISTNENEWKQFLKEYPDSAIKRRCRIFNFQFKRKPKTLRNMFMQYGPEDLETDPVDYGSKVRITEGNVTNSVIDVQRAILASEAKTLETYAFSEVYTMMMKNPKTIGRCRYSLQRILSGKPDIAMIALANSTIIKDEQKIGYYELLSFVKKLAVTALEHRGGSSLKESISVVNVRKIPFAYEPIRLIFDDVTLLMLSLDQCAYIVIEEPTMYFNKNGETFVRRGGQTEKISKEEQMILGKIPVEQTILEDLEEEQIDQLLKIETKAADEAKFKDEKLNKAIIVIRTMTNFLKLFGGGWAMFESMSNQCKPKAQHIREEVQRKQRIDDLIAVGALTREAITQGYGAKMDLEEMEEEYQEQLNEIKKARSARDDFKRGIGNSSDPMETSKKEGLVNLEAVSTDFLNSYNLAPPKATKEKVVAEAGAKGSVVYSDKPKRTQVSVKHVTDRVKAVKRQCQTFREAVQDELNNTFSNNKNEMIEREALKDPNLLPIMRKVMSNYVRVVGQCNGLMLCGNVGVTVGHVNDRDGHLFVRWKNIIYQATIIHRNAVRDQVFFKLPQEAPLAKDITSHLQQSDEVTVLKEADGIFCIPWKMENDDVTNCMSFQTVKIDTLTTYTPVKAEAPCEGIEFSGYEKTATGIMTTSPITAFGDCGSALFVVDSRVKNKIVGLHCASNKNVGYVTQLTYNTYVEATNKIAEQQSKEFTILDHQNILADQFEDEESGFTCVGRITNDKGEIIKCFRPMKTHLYNSPLKKADLEPEFEPAILDQKDVRNVDGVDVFNKNMAKWIVPQERAFNKELVVRAFHYVGKKIAYEIDEKKIKLKVMTKTEAINRATNIDASNPIERNSSAGFPWNQKEGVSKKSPMLKFDEEKQIWTIDMDNKYGRQLNKAVDDIVDNAARGKASGVVFAGNLKDELRKLEKIRDCKTRSFCGSPLCYTLAFRKFLHMAGAAIAQCHHDLAIKIGINAQSIDWHFMFKKLTKYGYHGFDGDYKAYDADMPRFMIDCLHIVFNQIYQLNDPNCKPLDHIIRRALIDCYSAPLLLYKNKVIVSPGGMVSGQPHTAVDNSIINMVYYYYTWWYVMDIMAERNVVSQSLVSFRSFDENCSLIVYGDDNLVIIYHEFHPIFNFQVFSKVMKDQFALTVTSAAKDGNEAKIKHITEMQFLKRTFNTEVMHPYIVGSLLEESFSKMLSFTHKDTPHVWTRDSEIDFDPEIIRNTAESCIIEISLLGREKYDDMLEHLRACFREIGLRWEHFDDWKTTFDSVYFRKSVAAPWRTTSLRIKNIEDDNNNLQRQCQYHQSITVLRTRPMEGLIHQ
ncbi:TPA_asm: non-structural polyprotein, partial [Apostichopus japonicus associated picornavirus 2]